MEILILSTIWCEKIYLVIYLVTELVWSLGFKLGQWNSWVHLLHHKGCYYSIFIHYTETFSSASEYIAKASRSVRLTQALVPLLTPFSLLQALFLFFSSCSLLQIKFKYQLLQQLFLSAAPPCVFCNLYLWYHCHRVTFLKQMKCF